MAKDKSRDEEEKGRKRRSRSKKDSKKKKRRKDSDDDRSDDSDGNPGRPGWMPVPPPPDTRQGQRDGPGRRSRSRDDPRQGMSSRHDFDGPGYRPSSFDTGKGKGKGKGTGDGDGEEQPPKEEPNFEASGLLAVEDNSKNGIPLKFTCPAEARRPDIKWRLYVFTKTDEAPKIIPIHRSVGYLFGKDRRVVDIPTDHQTCSKQHAVLHHRLQASGEVQPYIMDLESVNGTFLNGKRIESARYYEMKERDVLKFGMSSREFVLLHSGSANDQKIDPALLRSP